MKRGLCLSIFLTTCRAVPYLCASNEEGLDLRSLFEKEKAQFQNVDVAHRHDEGGSLYHQILREENF